MKLETIRKIQTAFGDQTMGVTQIKEQYYHFQDAQMSVKNNECSDSYFFHQQKFQKISIKLRNADE